MGLFWFLVQPTRSNLAKLTLELEVYGQTLCLFGFFLFKQKKIVEGVKVQNLITANAAPLDLMLFVTYLCRCA